MWQIKFNVNSCKFISLFLQSPPCFHCTLCFSTDDNKLIQMPPVISATLITDLLRKYLQPELGLAVQSWQCCYHQLEKQKVVQQMLLQITERRTEGKEKERAGKVRRSHWRYSLEFELPTLNRKTDKCYLWTQNLHSKCK